ncbi:MAG: hypothetical protein ACXVJW_14435 [Acidimicrobiia bacterium]
MIAALYPEDHVRESAIKIAAAQANLEAAIVWGTLQEDAFAILQLVSDARVGLDVALAAAA